MPLWDAVMIPHLYQLLQEIGLSVFVDLYFGVWISVLRHCYSQLAGLALLDRCDSCLSSVEHYLAATLASTSLLALSSYKQLIQ